MDLEYFIALYLAAQKFADENHRLKTETATAIADVQAEANEALRELAGVWRVHCNGLEADLKKAELGRTLADAHVNSLKRDIAKVEADHAVEVDALKDELATSDRVNAELERVTRERDKANRQLQTIRVAFEQLRAAVHPAQVFTVGGTVGVAGAGGGGISSAGIAGGAVGGAVGGAGGGGSLGNPHRAIALGARGVIDAGASGWLSSLDGDG